MANGRSAWLPAFLSDLIYGAPAAQPTTTTKPELKVTPQEAASAVQKVAEVVADVKATVEEQKLYTPSSFLERLKQDLLGYETTLTTHKEKFRKLSEEAMLVQKSQQDKYKEKTQNAGLQAHNIKQTAADLKQIIQREEDKEKPLILDLIKKSEAAKDATQVIEVCNQAKVLIGDLEESVLKVKNEIEKAQTNKSAFWALVKLLLKLTKLPDLTPSNLNEANDDQLWRAIHKDVEGYFTWLSSVKVDLIRTEKQAEAVLEGEQAKLNNEKIAEQVAQELGTKIIAEAIDTAVRDKMATAIAVPAATVEKAPAAVPVLVSPKAAKTTSVAAILTGLTGGSAGNGFDPVAWSDARQDLPLLGNQSTTPRTLQVPVNAAPALADLKSPQTAQYVGKPKSPQTALYNGNSAVRADSPHADTVQIDDGAPRRRRNSF